MPKATADELIDLMSVISEDIRETAWQQPTLFIKAARYRVEKMRVRAQKEAEVDSTKASLGVKFRNRKDEQGKKVYSEGGVKEKLEIQPKVIRLRGEMDRAFEEEELAKLILEAYRQRNSAIKIIAEMQQAEGHKEVVDLERDAQSKRIRNTARRLRDKSAEKEQ